MEEQIREHERVVINLKRARNALLNISKLPPEILGKIFQCNVTLEDDFDGLAERSHNFLSVCHHWHEVALHTPGVWSFGGNAPVDWARWYHHSGTAPLDLVLGGINHDDGSFDVALRDALQVRAARDTIRRIHLWSGEAVFLSSIISPLGPTCGGIRPNSVESLILVNEGDMTVDVSDFFAHYRFPKLRYLELSDCNITSWNLLTSRTAVLTSLILRLCDPSPTPTTSQLLSILASNPTLQKLILSTNTIPDDGGEAPPSRVPLHHLKELELTGSLRDVVGLLHRLDHPGYMDTLHISLVDCTTTDILQTIGPYLRHHLQRRGKSRDGLELVVSQFRYQIILQVGNIMGGADLYALVRGRVNLFVLISMELDQTPSYLLEKGALDLIAHTPQDEVISFRPSCGLSAVKDISTHFPNLKALHFETTPLLAIFPVPYPYGDGDVLPSLQHIFLRGTSSIDWTPLMAFLAHRVSSGDRLASLVVVGSHVCPEVEERIRGMVQKLRVDYQSQPCPLGVCTEQ